MTNMNEHGRPEIIVPLDDFEGLTASEVSIEMFGTADQWGPNESASDFYDAIRQDRERGQSIPF